MPVSFAEDLVEIREYELTFEERNDKRRALEQVRKDSNSQAHRIKNILYRNFLTEKKYVQKRENGSDSGGIRCVEGYSLINDEEKKLYSNGDKKIYYNIYLNEYGKMTAQIKTKGFGFSHEHYIKYFDSGCFLKDMLKAEYKAKMFVLEITRKLFNENNIL